MNLKSKLMNKLNMSSSKKNVSKITFGTIMGQIISLVAVPIYVRIYGASVMGLWTLFMSISTMILTFSDLGMKNAIMIEKEEDKTTELYTVVTTVAIGLTLISGIVLFIWYSIFGTGCDLSPLVVSGFIVILTITQQQTQICYTWINKHADYNVLMKNPIINNLFAALFIIVFGLCGWIKYGYYIGLLLGQFVTLFHMRLHLPKNFLTFKKEAYKSAFKDKKDFYLYQLPANIISQFKNQCPVFFIKSLFGSEILGYYSISMKYLKIPIRLLADSIGRVFFQTVSKMQRENKPVREIGEYSYRNICKAMYVALLPMMGILAVGDIGCAIMFGPDFIVAGNITRIVCFNSFFLFLATSTQGLPVILKKQSYIMISGIVQTAGYAVGLWIGKNIFDSIYVGCFIMTAVYAIAQIVFFIALFDKMEIKWYKYLVNVTVVVSIIVVGSFIVRIPLYFLHIINSIV